MVSEFLNKFRQIDFDKIVDHPNILIAASFWDEDRYRAARTCYKFMRTIDDLIDDHKSLNNSILPEKRAWFKKEVDEWLGAVKDPGKVKDSIQKELAETIKRYRIPHWCLDDFAGAMMYDIDNDGFPNLDSFLIYSEGASLAPSSIFIHLCGISKMNGGFALPEFNVRELSLPCAFFSYLVHIIRDFQKDQFDSLNYFADDLVAKHGLSRARLRQIAEEEIVPQGFRSLIREYMDIAENYRTRTLEAIETISPFLEPGYQLSLHIIYNLYLMVYERIDVENGSFTTEELNPTAHEIKERVLRTIVEFEN